jgi:hypothetical protein
MNFDELSEILREEAGINVCPICGTPFEKRYKQQKTCGTDECKRAHKNKYLRERRRKLLEKDREVFNKHHREAQQRYRNKKRGREAYEQSLDKVAEYWQRAKEKREEVYEDGFNYGKRQMERTLAMIPKINVNLEGSKTNDDVHDKDKSE